VGELLVVDAAEPARVESPRKAHLEVVERFAADGVEHGGLGCGYRTEDLGHDPVEGRAVDAGDVGDVLGALEPAFNLERGDAGPDEVGQHVETGKVLRAEQVAAVAEVHGPAVGDKLVGHAARLGAFAAVGGAAAEGLAGEALSGIGDAERAMHEDLEWHGGRARCP
jgi:hypothetical protein